MGKCNSCGASGKRDCKSCNASGKWTCNKCNNGYFQCFVCHGAKEVVCPRCEGEGQLFISRNGEVFPASSGLPGFGRVVTCRKCEGNQYIPCRKCEQTGELECRKCGGTGEVNCRHCNGAGQQDCRSCNGTGEYIPKHLRT